jgi:pimeloyl-ACP methyl ester carboxylesterase
MASIDRRTTLPDGRALGYDEHGPPDGEPLLYFHGTPSSRKEWLMFGNETLAERLGLRVVCVDRPGMGLSDFSPGRRILDWPADVGALADRLGLERLAVLGYSGGVPYALACALSIPERLAAVGIAACVGPHEIPGLTDGLDPNVLRVRKLCARTPWLGKLLWWMVGAQARYFPRRLLSQSRNALPEPDREIMAREEAQRAFITMLKEATRQGARGAQQDMALMASPWEFRPRDIEVPIRLWQGEEDTAATPAMARYLQRSIPESKARFYPGEGHVSLIVNHAEEIFETLAASIHRK